MFRRFLLVAPLPVSVASAATAYLVAVGILTPPPHIEGLQRATAALQTQMTRSLDISKIDSLRFNLRQELNLAHMQGADLPVDDLVDAIDANIVAISEVEDGFSDDCRTAEAHLKTQHATSTAYTPDQDLDACAASIILSFDGRDPSADDIVDLYLPRFDKNTVIDRLVRQLRTDTQELEGKLSSTPRLANLIPRVRW